MVCNTWTLVSKSGICWRFASLRLYSASSTRFCSSRRASRSACHALSLGATDGGNGGSRDTRRECSWQSSTAATSASFRSFTG